MELFDFTEILTDKDGDTVSVDANYNPLKEIQRFMSCTKKEACIILDNLKKDYDVYAGLCRIILTHGKTIEHDFEMYGQTYWHGHKYNTVNDWDFKEFVQKNKLKEKKSRPPKKLVLTVTEPQAKRARQIAYASMIGFDVDWHDYKRFYLV